MSFYISCTLFLACYATIKCQLGLDLLVLIGCVSLAAFDDALSLKLTNMLERRKFLFSTVQVYTICTLTYVIV